MLLKKYVNIWERCLFAFLLIDEKFFSVSNCVLLYFEFLHTVCVFTLTATVIHYNLPGCALVTVIAFHNADVSPSIMFILAT